MKSLHTVDIAQLITKSRTSERKRAALALHEANHSGPRVLVNAIQPGSYIQPHRHDAQFGEIWQHLTGEVTIVLHHDDGGIKEAVSLSKTYLRAFEVPPGEWHTAFALQPSVVYEISQGPYDERKYKEFASWAPREDEPEKASAYLTQLQEEAFRIRVRENTRIV
jgi:cupin fold WbuC family metalloprotein